MKKRAMRAFSCCLIFSILTSTLISLVPEVNAALRPYNFLGTVRSIDTISSTITIAAEFEWKDPIWTPTTQSLDGSAPEDAVEELVVGDYVEAASLGNPGETWVALGKMISKTDTVMTAIYGDPAHLISESMQGGYSVVYENEPNCTICLGCNCDALYTDITIKKGNTSVDTARLVPGESLKYKGEKYTVEITFYEGQAWIFPKCTSEPCYGPQSVSNFRVQVTEEDTVCIMVVLLLVIIAAILLIYWLARRKKEAKA